MISLRAASRKIRRISTHKDCGKLSFNYPITIFNVTYKVSINAVHKLFGAEPAGQSALHWIEELGLWIGRLESRFQATVVASARLAKYSGSELR
jgi:hypothetical protein